MYVVQLSTENVLGAVENLVLDFPTSKFLGFAFSTLCSSHFCWFLVITLSGSGWKESLEVSPKLLLKNSLLGKFRN